VSDPGHRVVFCGACFARFSGATPQDAASRLAAHYGDDQATCPNERERSVRDEEPAAPYHQARRSDPGTSHAAARTIERTKTRLERVVLEALRSAPAGLTSHELAARTGLSLVTVSPRLHPLMLRGEVVDTGERRAGATFRKSIVWRSL